MAVAKKVASVAISLIFAIAANFPGNAAASSVQRICTQYNSMYNICQTYVWTEGSNGWGWVPTGSPVFVLIGEAVVYD